MQREKGQMTVQEAGRKGGHKGGRTTSERYGRGFYSEIGHKGGQRVRELIEEARNMEDEDMSERKGRMR
ncbi:MAG: Em GEA1 (EM1) [Patescibacteria group bacterium]|nr:Em GEA1 (EM1) [Patescibacteria group bacterium]